MLPEACFGRCARSLFVYVLAFTLALVIHFGTWHSLSTAVFHFSTCRSLWNLAFTSKAVVCFNISTPVVHFTIHDDEVDVNTARGTSRRSS